MDVRVLSIGAMTINGLWGETQPSRTGHTTTTLIRSGDATILVDPGLPAPGLEARLAERVNLTPDKITHVFLTSFRPDARRAIELFDDAKWLIAERERESAGVPLAQTLKRIAERDATDEIPEGLIEAAQRDLAIMQRCEAAPDRLAEGVSLFPLPGVTLGMTGLLIETRHTILITGDAIPTVDHLERGQIPTPCVDGDAARGSFEEAVEIADLLILGRDNLAPNPMRPMLGGLPGAV